MNVNKDKQNICKLQIKDFGEIVTGSTPPTALNRYWKGDFCFYSPSDFSDNAYCNKTEKTITLLGLKQGREIPINSVMVTCIASIGKLAINTKLGITNQQINTIIVNQNFDSKYIYYLLCKNIDQIKNSAAQTSVPIINKTDFGNIELFVNYNKKEQGHIAQILTTCDKVIEQTEAVIAKYKAIKQGMLHDLFTRGLDKNGKLRPTPTEAPELYKESELGLIPKDWDVKRLNEIATMKSGEEITSQFISNHGNYPVYGGNGLRGFTSSYTHEGDFVLVGRQGALCGNTVRASGKFYASEHAVVVNTFNFIDVDWLFQKLKGMNLNQYSEASAQPGLAVSKILRLFIETPSDNEQKLISKSLLSIDYKISREEKVLNKYILIKRGLMRTLLKI